MTPRSAPLRSRIPTTLVFSVVAAALVAGCEALPTAAEIETMDVAAVEARSQRLLDGSEAAPLYVVDGVVVTPEAARDLANENIASISVVRGPAAVERYGAAAAAGVLEIITFNPRDFVAEEQVGVWSADIGQTDDPSRIAANGSPIEIVRRSEVDATGDAAGEPSSAAAQEVRLLRASAEQARGQVRPTPLLVVDGVIVDPDQNPNFSLSTLDIASMEVIKGGAAATMFGPRAAVGAIVITTNRAAR